MIIDDFLEHFGELHGQVTSAVYAKYSEIVEEPINFTTFNRYIRENTNYKSKTRWIEGSPQLVWRSGKVASDLYEQQVDIVQEFVGNRRLEMVPNGQLHEEYVAWAEANELRHVTKIPFNRIVRDISGYDTKNVFIDGKVEFVWTEEI